jgi:hypothetical protein
MKPKLTFAALALLAGLGLLCLIRWQPGFKAAGTKDIPLASPPTAAVSGARMKPAPPTDTKAHPRATQTLYETSTDTTPFSTIEAEFDAADSFHFPSLLAELELMPESPVKRSMIREALMKWATLDGAAAATWAKLNGPYRSFLPEILQAWAGKGPEFAVDAWAFAKAAAATDGDKAAWHGPDFITTAFREMTAIPDEKVWSELATLQDGASTAAAMLGMADFAANRQVNTDFASEMERRVLDFGSAPLAAAFYAGAGHIAAAKEELAGVTEAEQWHAIACEVARQQAVFEPAQALDWLQSQFEHPSDAIADMVESIGMTHALNAEDVLNWLSTLPNSEARAAGIERIREAYPQFKANSPVEVISLD